MPVQRYRIPLYGLHCARYNIVGDGPVVDDRMLSVRIDITCSLNTSSGITYAEYKWYAPEHAEPSALNWISRPCRVFNNILHIRRASLTPDLNQSHQILNEKGKMVLSILVCTSYHQGHRLVTICNLSFEYSDLSYYANVQREKTVNTYHAVPCRYAPTLVHPTSLFMMHLKYPVVSESRPINDNRSRNDRGVLLYDLHAAHGPCTLISQHLQNG